MTAGAGRSISPRTIVLGAVTMLYPLFVYAGMEHVSPRAMALGLAALIVLRVALLGGRALALAIAAGGAAIVAAVAVSGAWLPLKLYPALVNGALLAVFAWSLWHPPSVVERIARLTEPDLPTAGVAYTRKVTVAWCLFFVINGALATGTALWASERIWALYNGLLAYLLIGAMFGGEWLIRRRVRARDGHG